MGKKRFKKQEGPAGRYGGIGMEAKRGRLGVTAGPAWRLRGAGMEAKRSWLGVTEGPA